MSSKKLHERGMAKTIARIAAIGMFGFLFATPAKADASDENAARLVAMGAPAAYAPGSQIARSSLPTLPRAVKAARTPSKPGQVKPAPTLAVTEGKVVFTKSKKRNPVMEFYVTLSRTYNKKVNFSFATTPGTALAGTDFTALSGEAGIKPGVKKFRVRVPILGTVPTGGTESFGLSLTAADGATIEDADGTGVINAPAKVNAKK